MQCPQCQTEIREGVRFCEDCGARIALSCSTCGAEILPGEKFCGSCGTPVDGHAEEQSASTETYTEVVPENRTVG